MEKKEWLTPKEASTMLGINKSTLKRWREKDKVEAIKGNYCWFYNYDSLDELRTERQSNEGWVSEVLAKGLCGVTSKILTQFRKSGLIKARRNTGGRWIYDLESLKDLVNSCDYVKAHYTSDQGWISTEQASLLSGYTKPGIDWWAKKKKIKRIKKGKFVFYERETFLNHLRAIQEEEGDWLLISQAVAVTQFSEGKIKRARKKGLIEVKKNDQGYWLYSKESLNEYKKNEHEKNKNSRFTKAEEVDLGTLKDSLWITRKEAIVLSNFPKTTFEEWARKGLFTKKTDSNNRVWYETESILQHQRGKTQDNSNLISNKEAIELTGLSHYKLLKLITQGQINGCKDDWTGHWKFDKESILAYLSERMKPSLAGSDAGTIESQAEQLHTG
ncbi:MAG: helix-turn-helix domain-containing protein [Moorea sp. SIO4G2]|nr:helix-turn-helix domain-containing protein [Moorena sp. SIO4G2]